MSFVSNIVRFEVSSDEFDIFASSAGKFNIINLDHFAHALCSPWRLVEIHRTFRRLRKNMAWNYNGQCSGFQEKLWSGEGGPRFAAVDFLFLWRSRRRQQLLFSVGHGVIVPVRTGAIVFIAECDPFCAMQARFEFDFADSEDLVVNTKPQVVPSVFPALNT